MINLMEYVNSLNVSSPRNIEKVPLLFGHKTPVTQPLATSWYHLRLSFNSLACLGCTDSN